MSSWPRYCPRHYPRPVLDVWSLMTRFGQTWSANPQNGTSRNLFPPFFVSKRRCHRKLTMSKMRPRHVVDASWTCRGCVVAPWTVELTGGAQATCGKVMELWWKHRETIVVPFCGSFPTHDICHDTCHDTIRDTTTQSGIRPFLLVCTIA